MARSRFDSVLRTTGARRPWKSRSTAMARCTGWCTCSSPSPTEALRCGKSSMASTTARATNGRYVRLKPSWSFHADLWARRTRSTPSKSTSMAVSTWGEVCWERTMCSPVRLRMLFRGSMEVPSAVAFTRIGARGAGAAAAAGAGGAGAGVVPALDSAAARTSLRVMRPPGPVPVRAAGSRSCLWMRRRTSGESTRPPPTSAGPTCGGGRRRPATGAAGDSGAAGRRGLAGWSRNCGCRGLGRRFGGARPERWLAGAGSGSAGTAAGAPAPSPRTANRVPTSTVSPSATMISWSTPDAGEGTSESTLSVDTSKSGSSTSTRSPTALNHWVIVPSVTVSPNWGISTSAMCPLSSSTRLAVQSSTREGQDRLPEVLRQRRVGWMNGATSSTVASQFTARYPWPSCSVTQGPTMCTPRICPARPSASLTAMIFTSPSASPMIKARPLPPRRCLTVATS